MTRSVRPESAATLAVTPATLQIILGRPLKPEPTIVTVDVLPTVTVPATRVALKGSTKVTFVAAEDATMFVASPALVAVTRHVPALLALSEVPERVQPADDPAAKV
jgi:hypothetical protein